MFPGGRGPHRQPQPAEQVPRPVLLFEERRGILQDAGCVDANPQVAVGGCSGGDDRYREYCSVSSVPQQTGTIPPGPNKVCRRGPDNVVPVHHLPVPVQSAVVSPPSLGLEAITAAAATGCTVSALQQVDSPRQKLVFECAGSRLVCVWTPTTYSIRGFERVSIVDANPFSADTLQYFCATNWFVPSNYRGLQATLVKWAELVQQLGTD